MTVSVETTFVPDANYIQLGCIETVSREAQRHVRILHESVDDWKKLEASVQQARHWQLTSSHELDQEEIATSINAVLEAL